MLRYLEYKIYLWHVIVVGVGFVMAACTACAHQKKSGSVFDSSGMRTIPIGEEDSELKNRK